MRQIKILVASEKKASCMMIKTLFKEASLDAYQLSWLDTKKVNFDQKLISECDVFLVDLSLGSGSSFEVVKKLKNSGSNAALILITDEGGKVSSEAIFKMGVDDHMFKTEVGCDFLDRSIRYSIERKKNEQLLLNQQEQLFSIVGSSLLGELVSGFAHEINNPIALLTIILTNLKRRIAKGNYTQEQIFELVGKAQESIGRMNKVTGSLSRYNADINMDIFTSANLVDLLEESLKVCSGKLRFNKVKVNISYPRKELYINCRTSDFTKVLVNIINSAIGAVAGLKERWIEVSVCERSDFFEIVFKDSSETGIQELREQKYTPQFITEKRDGGTGLGFSLSKSIIESHGGSIVFPESSECEDKITITLPRKKSEFSQGEHTVLIVDNKVEMRSLFARILSDYNLKSLEASTLNEALETFKNNQEINVIVVDIDGEELKEAILLRLLNQFKNLQGVALTGAAEKFQFTDMSLANNKKLRVFKKPFETQELVNFCT